jgi:hypothetical protein
VTNPRRLFFLFALIALAMTALLVASCDDSDDSGADELTLEQYFAEVETIFETSSETTEQLNTDLDDSLSEATTFEEQLAALETFVAGASDLYLDSIAAMEDLPPPVETEQPHNDFIEATTDIANATGGLSDGLSDAEDNADVTRLLDEFESEIAESLFAVDQACEDLQDTADDNAIEADLRCTERVFPERPQDPS